MQARPARVTAVRFAFAAAGWFAVTLAIVGVFVPGMPATVFVLAASYCFSRSSSRFEDWLRHHAWLGPILERFVTNGGMPASGKRRALAAMWVSVLASSCLLAAARPALAVVTVALGIAGTVSIVFAVRTVPEPSRAGARS